MLHCVRKAGNRALNVFTPSYVNVSSVVSQFLRFLHWHRQTDIHTDTQTYIQTHRHTDIHRDKQTYIETHRHIQISKRVLLIVKCFGPCIITTIIIIIQNKLKTISVSLIIALMQIITLVVWLFAYLSLRNSLPYCNYLLFNHLTIKVKPPKQPITNPLQPNEPNSLLAT